MNNFNKFIILNILLMLCSCGIVKEGFTNPKKNSSDEFLVEKKSPLIMPPNYGELPTPLNQNNSEENQINNIESLISKKKGKPKLDNTEQIQNIEESILDKIKNN
jgi:hypothetical protein